MSVTGLNAVLSPVIGPGGSDQLGHILYFLVSAVAG